MDLDRTHHQDRTHQCHETGPRMESSRVKKTRRTKNNWSSIVEELKKHGTTWKEMEKAANNSVLEKCRFGSICSTLTAVDYSL